MTPANSMMTMADAAWQAELPAGGVLRDALGRACIAEVGEGGEHDTLVLISWRLEAGWAERVRVQVVVDGQLAAVADRAGQESLWLVLDRRTPRRVELRAVDAATPEVWWSPPPPDTCNASGEAGDRVSLAVGRDEAWPVDTRLAVELDGRRVAAGPLWSGGDPRSGFGGLFGLGSFGHDAAAGPGLGQGELGLGPLGTDAAAWRYTSPALAAGESGHTLSLHTLDAAGRPLAPPLTLAPITTEALPTPPRHLAMSSDFTLTWTD